MRDSGRRRTLQRAGSAPVALGTCLAGLMVLQSGGGCVPSRMELGAFLKSDEYLASGSGYRVLPGDAVSITSPQVLELDGTKEPVGINGKIDLDLIGQIHVAGLTPKEIRNKLELQLAPYYAEPQLRVRVAEGVSKKIYEQDGQLKLCNINPKIYEIFKITRLTKVFDIYDDVEGAVASLSMSD